ncbi:hypothetical protein C8J55DRAFT_526220, partial [Lentinula edodes]
MPIPYLHLFSPIRVLLVHSTVSAATTQLKPLGFHCATLSQYNPFILAAVYHPRLDEHSLHRRLLGPAVPLWDPVDSTEPRIYLSIYLP